jgi:hypothetical protein
VFLVVLHLGSVRTVRYRLQLEAAVALLILQHIFNYVALLPASKAPVKCAKLLEELFGDLAEGSPSSSIMSAVAGVNTGSIASAMLEPAAVASSRVLDPMAAVSSAAAGDGSQAGVSLSQEEAARQLLLLRAGRAGTELRDRLRAADLVAVAPGEGPASAHRPHIPQKKPCHVLIACCNITHHVPMGSNVANQLSQLRLVRSIRHEVAAVEAMYVWSVPSR